MLYIMLFTGVIIIFFIILILIYIILKSMDSIILIIYALESRVNLLEHQLKELILLSEKTEKCEEDEK